MTNQKLTRVTTKSDSSAIKNLSDFAKPVSTSTKHPKPNNSQLQLHRRIGSTPRRSARRTSSWCRWASSLYCWRSPASAPPTPVPRASACSAAVWAPTTVATTPSRRALTRRRPPPSPTPRRCHGRRKNQPARGRADHAEPAEAAGHRTDGLRVAAVACGRGAHGRPLHLLQRGGRHAGGGGGPAQRFTCWCSTAPRT